VQRGVAFEGTVTWPDGTPVREFTCRFGSQWGQGVLGKFRFVHVMPEEDELWVHAVEEEREGWLTVRTSPRAAQRRHVLQASDRRAHVELTVTVADPSGKGLTAGLEWQSLSDPSSGGNLTCSSGPRAPEPETFLVPLGDVRLTVTRGGYAQVERTLTILEPTSIHFVLQPAGLVRGVVFDERGEPVEGAEVFCSNWSADTDAQGRFELRPASTQGGLIAWMDGHAYSEPVPISVAPGQVVEGVVLRLRECCVLEGTFSDLQRESYELRLEAGGHVQEIEAEGGFFVLDDLPPGPGSVAVLLDDERLGPRVDFVLTPGRTTRVELATR